MDCATTLERAGKLQLRLEARFLVAGTSWLISTNSTEILGAARETFLPAGEASSSADFSVRFYVDSTLQGKPPWPQPYFRGLDHLVYACYDAQSSMLADLRGRRAIGLFSPAMALDQAYWKRVLLPVLLGIASAPIGITPLHCACLVKNELGLVLGGMSGAGKSTLALSLCLNGFSYLSDDWTYFSRYGSGVQAWGLPTPVKLLPDTIEYFPQLRDIDPLPSLNGELAFEVDLVARFGVARTLCCEPRWLVFIERTKDHRAVFRPISSEEAASRFAAGLETLPACIAGMRELQMETIRSLVKRDCWVLRHGMPPAPVAHALAEFCRA